MTIKVNNTNITIYEDELVVTRILDNKVYKFPMKVDGTIKDMLSKIDKVDNLDDEIFKDFSSIYKNSINVD